ncbi:MAG: dihydroorotase [Candidatus Marinimicrobia bacterium]|nr:dihydroorotase [Candidatus Neomarinimicrobiota bacterium]
MALEKIPKNLILKGGTIIDPNNEETYEADILIKDGLIDEIGSFKIPDNCEIIDCSGKVITHGFCDLHVHFREPGREDKETLQTGSLAAMAGGFTRVCVMPNTNPPLDTPESINFIKKKAEDAPIHIHPIGAVSKGQNGKDITEMGLMYKEGAVAFSDDGLPIQDGGIMRIALEYSKLVGVPVINHAEDECLRDGGLMHEGTISTHLGLSGNPDLAESSMVHRDLELANFVGAKIHIPHVSSLKAVDLIRDMKKQNGDVTAEVTPHHLFFNDEDLISYDTNLKVGPPIRTENDRISLISALKDGTIDCIATDHAPHTMQDKETTFDLASFGMIGLESCFGAVNKILCKDSDLSLETLIQKMTCSPRKIMGFDTDLLKRNKSAEIVVIDPKTKWVFEKLNIKSKSKNSPYVGKDLYGKVLYTISRSNIYKNS